MIIFFKIENGIDSKIKKIPRLSAKYFHEFVSYSIPNFL